MDRMIALLAAYTDGDDSDLQALTDLEIRALLDRLDPMQSAGETRVQVLAAQVRAYDAEGRDARALVRQRDEAIREQSERGAFRKALKRILATRREDYRREAVIGMARALARIEATHGKLDAAFEAGDLEDDELDERLDEIAEALDDLDGAAPGWRDLLPPDVARAARAG